MSGWTSAKFRDNVLIHICMSVRRETELLCCGTQSGAWTATVDKRAHISLNLASEENLRCEIIPYR